MLYDLNKALQTVDYHSTITCRTCEQGAIFKTLLSVDDTTEVAAACPGGLKVAMGSDLCQDVLERMMRRKVKSCFLQGDRRLTVYHY